MSANEMKKENLPVPAESRPAPVPFDSRSNLDLVADKLQALEKIGEYLANSGLCGAKSKAQGVVVAMFGVEHHMPMTDVGMKYHVITTYDGKTSLSIKGHELVARFQLRGGEHVVRKLTDTECIIYDKAHHLPGKPDRESSLTMKDVCRMLGVQDLNPKSTWAKNPKRMLYVRCSVNNIMMLDPGAADGAPVMEENEAPGEPVDDQTPLREDDNDLSKHVKIEVTTPPAVDAPHGTFDGKGEHAAAFVVTDDGPKPVPTPTEQDAATSGHGIHGATHRGLLLDYKR